VKGIAMPIRSTQICRILRGLLILLVVSLASCRENEVTKNRTTATPQMSILPVITIDKSERQEVELEILNRSAKEVVYHRQQYPTPIYHLGFDFVMEGKQLTTETLEGELFSKDGIRTLAPGESLSCSISMGAYEFPQNRTGSLPAGRYQMNAFYHLGEHWKAYEEKYGMTPVHLNRPAALIDLIDRASRESSDYDLGAMRRRWASREIQEANLRPLHGGAFADDPNTPLAVIPVIRFAKRQKSMNVNLEIQNVSSAAIRYATGGKGRRLRDLELTLTREGEETPIQDRRDPRDKHSVATLKAYQSIPLSISLNDYEFAGAEGAPLGRYELHAKYLVDEGSAADEGITPIEFDRAILLIDLVED
jgi:hypothetical protein